MRRNKLLCFGVPCLALSLAVGIAAPLLTTLLGGGAVSDSALGAAYVTVLGFLFVVCIVEVISVFKIDDSTFHTALIAGCLFVLYALSVDMDLFLKNFGVDIPLYALGISSELAFALAEACCCWYILFLYRIPISNRSAAIVTVCAMASLMGYSLAVIFGYGYIFHFLLSAIYIIVFCLILERVWAEKNVLFTTYLVTAVFSLAIGVQSVNALSYSGPALPVQGIALAFAVLTFAAFATVYFLFSVHTDLRAVRSDEYKLQARHFETRALTWQIKPHFIFNSLEALRALYHKDIALGDEGLAHLSDFLRGSIRSFDSDLVPFETEIDNIYNYAEFENLKRDGKMEVIFDIDFTEFSVPPFSIQPFVENAFKYSGVEETGGRIVISSYREEDRAVVEISDNGKGFDPSAVSDRSHGIRNACGRFALALGAHPEIKSEPGKGTQVKIVIDINGRGKKV